MGKERPVNAAYPLHALRLTLLICGLFTACTTSDGEKEYDEIAAPEKPLEAAAAEGLSEEQQLEAQLARLGKRVAQIRPDGDCLFSSVADQLRRIGARQPALPACYDVC